MFGTRHLLKIDAAIATYFYNQIYTTLRLAMKYFRIGLLVLLLLACGLVGMTYLLPDRLHVAQSVYLGVPPEQVRSLLNNPSQWPSWSILNKQQDPSLIHLYSGPEQGSGATLRWSGDKLGNGHLVLQASTSADSVNYTQLSGDSAYPIQGYFVLQTYSQGTRLTWHQHSQVGSSPLARLQGLLRQYRMQQEVKQGLTGLSSMAQNRRKS